MAVERHTAAWNSAGPVIPLSSVADSLPGDPSALGQRSAQGCASGGELDQEARNSHEDKNNLPVDLESHLLLYLKLVIGDHSNLVSNICLRREANLLD